MLTAGEGRGRNKNKPVCLFPCLEWVVSEVHTRDLRACVSWLLEDNHEGRRFQFQGNNYK